jgi:hypothetical protein
MGVMDAMDPNPQDPNPEARTTRPRRKLWAGVAAATASVAGVGGLAYALTAGAGAVTPAAATQSVTSSPASQLAAGGTSTAPSNGRAGVGRLLRRAVHVEIVVPKQGGGFRTIDIDRGTVTAISSTSITVTPAGGRAPVTAAITSATRQPAGAVTQSEQVVLVSSDGNALIVRPVHAAGGAMSQANGSSGANAAGVAGARLTLS